MAPVGAVRIPTHKLPTYEEGRAVAALDEPIYQMTYAATALNTGRATRPAARAYNAAHGKSCPIRRNAPPTAMRASIAASHPKLTCRGSGKGECPR